MTPVLNGADLYKKLDDETYFEYTIIRAIPALQNKEVLDLMIKADDLQAELHEAKAKARAEAEAKVAVGAAKLAHKGLKAYKKSKKII